MAIIQIKTMCKRCGMEVYQWVTYREDKGGIEIEAYQEKCSACQGFLKKPDSQKVKRVEKMQEKK